MHLKIINLERWLRTVPFRKEMNAVGKSIFLNDDSDILYGGTGRDINLHL